MKKKPVCLWKRDPDDDCDRNWISGCHKLWEFIERGPTENGIRFCPFCGKRVKTKDK